MIRDHKKAIKLMNKHLKEYGVVSFPELNEAAGAPVLSRLILQTNRNDTAKEINVSIALGTHTLVKLPIQMASRQRSKKGALRTVYHLIETELEPFILHTQIQGQRGKRDIGYHYLVNTLFDIDEQDKKDGHVLLGQGVKGTQMLKKMGLIELVKYKSGTKPKEFDSNIQRFKLTNPELISRATVAVKRVFELQKARFNR